MGARSAGADLARLAATGDIVERLGGPPARAAAAAPPFLIVEAGGDARLLAAYGALRRRAFVHEQELFGRHDRDDADGDPRTRVLVAVATSRVGSGRLGEPDPTVLGGVRLHPEGDGPEIGWWRGSRLVVDGRSGARRGTIGAALVRAACATALDAGALRFDAHVQRRQARFFARLGWETVRPLQLEGAPHLLMRWPVARFAQLAQATKAPLGALLAGVLPHDRWRGDDGVPLAGSDVVACADAIVPSMVERDPEWAGWCGMLVTAHDLAAMGAAPLGALDLLAAADGAHAARVLDGLKRGADAFALPLLGGHTQLGVPAALGVTGFGRSDAPIAAGGGRAGDLLRVTADLHGGWRPGYHGRQWDSTSWRTRVELAPMLSAVRRARPAAAKDVSMAGIVGTTGMLAEASGCGAELEVAAIPRPAAAGLADWLTCFPGFAVVTADRPHGSGAPTHAGGGRNELPLDAGAAVGARCGRLDAAPGVRLRWPDGELTEALPGGVTGLGEARGAGRLGSGATRSTTCEEQR